MEIVMGQIVYKLVKYIQSIITSFFYRETCDFVYSYHLERTLFFPLDFFTFLSFKIAFKRVNIDKIQNETIPTIINVNLLLNKIIGLSVS